MTIVPERFQPYAQTALRVVVGLLFLQHGLAKLIDFPHMDGLDQMPAGLKIFAGFVESLGGLALIAAFILSGFAAVAYFMVHAPMGFFPALNFGEPAVLFCFAALFLAAAGPGRWAFDPR